MHARVGAKVWNHGVKNMRILTNLLTWMWWVVINAIIDPLIPCLPISWGSNDLFMGSMKRRNARTLTLMHAHSHSTHEWGVYLDLHTLFLYFHQQMPNSTLFSPAWCRPIPVSPWERPWRQREFRRNLCVWVCFHSHTFKKDNNNRIDAFKW